MWGVSSIVLLYSVVTAGCFSVVFTSLKKEVEPPIYCGDLRAVVLKTIDHSSTLQGSCMTHTEMH